MANYANASFLVRVLVVLEMRSASKTHQFQVVLSINVRISCYLFMHMNPCSVFNVFCQTDASRRVDCLAPPPVFHMKMEASR